MEGVDRAQDDPTRSDEYSGGDLSFAQVQNNFQMNLGLSMFACFCAVQAGALVICVGTMVVDSGPIALVEGIAVWIVGQIAIFPMALMFMPAGALVRMVLGLLCKRPRFVALVTGTLIGILGVLVVSIGVTVNDSIQLAVFVGIGGLAGLSGGWVWWRVERRHLEGIGA